MEVAEAIAHYTYMDGYSVAYLYGLGLGLFAPWFADYLNVKPYRLGIFVTAVVIHMLLT